METPSRSAIERNLERFIAEELVSDSAYEGGDPLAVEAVDSLGYEQLIDYIAEEFRVSVVDEDINEENFGSIAALAAFVDAARRRAVS